MDSGIKLFFCKKKSRRKLQMVTGQDATPDCPSLHCSQSRQVLHVQ
uniref:Uncharacterized protein n=1 Tax=Arundo donax TaxID=35708 RepID=A0A0A9EAG0_ARUDO